MIVSGWIACNRLALKLPGHRQSFFDVPIRLGTTNHWLHPGPSAGKPSSRVASWFSCADRGLAVSMTEFILQHTGDFELAM